MKRDLNNIKLTINYCFKLINIIVIYRCPDERNHAVSYLLHPKYSPFFIVTILFSLSLFNCMRIRIYKRNKISEEKLTKKLELLKNC